MGFRLSLLSLILSFSLLSRADVIEERRPTRVEVEVMVAKRRYLEAIREIPNVLPSDRGSNWDGLVEKAATGYLTDLENQGDSQAFDMSNRLMKQYPLLKRSQTFQSARNQLVINGFKKCFANPKDRTECRRRVKLTLQAEPENVVLILGVGAVVAKSFPTSLLDIYAGAINFGNRADLCGSSEFQEAILGNLTAKDKNIARLAQGLLEKECWDTIAEKSSSPMDRQLASDSQRNVICRLAKKKKSQKLMALCAEKP